MENPNVAFANRPLFALNADNIDTFEIDNYAIPNTITLPLMNKTKAHYIQNKAVYKSLIAENSEYADIKYSNYVISLLVEAKDGHNIFDYDKCYNYYIGAFVMVNGKTVLIKEDISDSITDDEKAYIHKAMWNYRDIKAVLKRDAEEALANFDKSDTFTLFSHGIEDKNYTGVWKSEKHKGCVLVSIIDCNNPTSAVMIEDCRFD